MAYTRADRKEQIRYAIETMNLPYEKFIARKADFERAGCRIENFETNGSPYPKQCRKPSPYNAFNWTDDGCSGREFPVVGKPISNIYRNLFNQPCQLHDFGYRNFGNGLQIGRNQQVRADIDGRFSTEMNRLCEKTYTGWKREECKNTASLVWGFVRKWGDSDDKWDKPAKTQLAPLDPDPSPTTTPPTNSTPNQTTFFVMNTSESPPDGVWFRDSPSSSAGPRVNGYGVYMNDKVQLQCFGWGESVGAHANRLWYRAANLTRPSAPGRANVGWLNAHYVNDGKRTNVVADGVPAC